MRISLTLIFFFGSCAVASSNQPVSAPISSSVAGDVSLDDFPSSGGPSKEEAEVIGGSIPVTVEGVIEPGQERWYRFEPPIKGGQSVSLVNSTRLLVNEPFTLGVNNSVYGRTDYFREDMTVESFQSFNPRVTLADDGFTEDAGAASLRGAIVYLKVSLKPDAVGAVHYRATVKKWL